MANISKDQRIINQNPGLTPHELLLKGISAAKYEELIKQEESKITAPVQKTPEEKIAPIAQPEPAKSIPQVQPIQQKSTPIVKAIPKTNAPAPMFSNANEMVYVIDKTGKTRPIYMSRAIAMKWVRKYPKEFEIK